MHRFTNILGGLSLAFLLTACGGGYSGFVIPVETELKPWAVPSEEEILERLGMESDEGTDDAYEEYEDGEEEGDGDGGDSSAPAPASANS
jgi:hypothetical protein